jgi:hypothetical protein
MKSGLWRVKDSSLLKTLVNGKRAIAFFAGLPMPEISLGVHAARAIYGAARTKGAAVLLDGISSLRKT